jgi:23S rRNA pseudouridine1911/1915/1917 synthase
MKFTVEPQDAGRRLDTVVSRLLGQTRSQVAKLLRSGAVELEGKPARASQQVNDGQQITVRLANNSETKPAVVPKLEILYEDDDLLVVDKPAGLVVHATESKRPQPTVADFASEQGVIDPGSERPGIVHRLDKDTSGVLVLAKNPKSKKYLQQLFASRKVKKNYLAVVRGRLKPAEAVIELPLGRSRSQPTKRAVVPGGRASTTHYRVLEEKQGASFVEVDLQTGRTHQIRAHFAHLGHPVVGDGFYGGHRPGDPGRQFLHARSIEFTGPHGQSVKVESPLPSDLASWLKQSSDGV